MIKEPNIYAVIIGSEILDRRREDKHFEYLSSSLAHIGLKLHASFIIKDDKDLMQQTYTMIHKDPHAIMFSFGGIGSTPDDLTRQVSANVFGDARLYRHPTFEKDIIKRLGERAYPHPIKMADLPKGSELLFNPINNMSGYHLSKRFFFMPGFPEMAQPMIDAILSSFMPEAQPLFHKGFIAHCGESTLQDLMTKVPKEIELSSLPMMNNGNARVEFSLSSKDKDKLENEFLSFTKFLDTQNIKYSLL